MTEIRCVKCRRRLFDAILKGIVVIEIICPKCGYKQNISANNYLPLIKED